MRNPSKSRSGFSLILSLTVMAMLVLSLVVIASLIAVESRLANHSHQLARARLNAVVSLKLALGHLQQEAGPDRRSTARADITQPEVIFAYKFRNPMWTGVWRTDFPDVPPAWLVSGRHDFDPTTQSAAAQSVTLGPSSEKMVGYDRFSSPRLTGGDNDLGDYPASTLTPWQTDYAPPAERLVPLVSTGSATKDEGGLSAAGTIISAKPSGLVSLPKIDLPGAAYEDDTIRNSTGSFAYWIGDEGVKARLNLSDTRKQNTASAEQLISLRSPNAIAYGLIPGLGTLTKPEDLQKVQRTSHLGLLSGFTAATSDYPNTDKRLFHDVTFAAAGVLADSAHGGLKRDLSVAFELSDEQFANSEFGKSRFEINNSLGVPHEFNAAAIHNLNGYEADERVEEAEIRQLVLTDAANRRYYAAPVFNRSNGLGGTLRGPTWWALRDYHRLYKQIGWGSTLGTAGRSIGSNPTLIARSFYPNVTAGHPEGKPASNNGIRNRLYGYSDVFNGEAAGSNPNAPIGDYDNGNLVPRPLNCAVSPYVSRVQLVFSVNKEEVVTRTIERVWDPVRRRWIWVEWTRRSVTLWLNLTPVVSIHNPYNVALQFRRMTQNGDQSVAISFSDMSKWSFVVRNYATPTSPKTIPLSEFFNMQAADTATEADTFKVYLPKDVVIAPGETRVFSCPPGNEKWAQSVQLTNTYSSTGGFFDDAADWGFGSASVFDLTNAIGMQINPAGGNFRMRHALTCWPGDELKNNGNTVDFFFNSSEQAEVVHKNISDTTFSSLKPGAYGAPAGEKFFSDYSYINDKFNPDGSPAEPSIISVIEIAAKTADSTTPDLASAATASPFPTYTHSNPLAASSRPDGAGRNPTSGAALTGAAPSYELKIMTPDSWDNLIELVPRTAAQELDPNAPTIAYNGYTRRAGDGIKAILTEVPLVQPTSLAQYTHANFGVRDQAPLFSIGNSFATTLVPTEKAWHNYSGWTEYDQTYLLNAALWDGYFLSSIAPQMTTVDTTPLAPRISNLGIKNLQGDLVVPLYYDNLNGNSTEKAPDDLPPPHTPKLTKESVVKSFVQGITPLDNPRFALITPAGKETSQEVLLADHRRSASVLLNTGAFNVNSTSVEAWKSFLGSTRKMAMLDGNSQLPVNAPFPRTLSPTGAIKAEGNMTDSRAWTGFSDLTDDKITALAQAIVDENKLRFQVRTRTEWDQGAATPPKERLFRGLRKAVTPYLSLSEFINRFLSPLTESDTGRCGALQAAIFRADQTANTGLSDRLYLGLPPEAALTAASVSTPTSSWSFAPKNIEMIAPGGTSRTHTALGAPGNLLQSDLLQSLGPALATRSDTFTIRCYGDANVLEGLPAKAWIEAVVQRMPEFIDATNVPETGASAPRPMLIRVDPDPKLDPLLNDPPIPASLSRFITPVNHALGRRFKVISVRWLNPDDI